MSREYGSNVAYGCVNVIRSLVNSMNIKPNPNLEMIPLSLGDPTVFGNLKTSDITSQIVCDTVKAGKNNGYVPTQGINQAREAVANYSKNDGFTPTMEDVILTNGGSGALDLCITASVNSGECILIPSPGFPLYELLAKTMGIHVKHYPLDPERNWEIDMEQLKHLLCKNTRAIVVNNPSNPCGAVYERKHLEKIVSFAEEHELIIIADEIYEHMTFEKSAYVPLSSITKKAPVLSCSGLTKRFLVPGWRSGWIVICDKANVAPKENLLISLEALKDVPGLTPSVPKGAMYMVVKIDMLAYPQFKDDVDFCSKMVSEVSVFCLPCSSFKLEGWIRLVLSLPHDIMKEACERIAKFCKKHRKTA